MTTFARIDTRALLSLINLVDLIGADVPGGLRREAGTRGGEWSGACPFCGGENRLRVQPAARPGGAWWCRQCSQRWVGAIDYVCRRRGMGFVEACEWLGDWAAGAGGVAPTIAIAKTSAMQGPPSLDWQARGWGIAADCARILWSSAEAAPARDYLLSRGLGRDEWRRWMIGYNPDARRDAAQVWGLEGDDVWTPEGVTIPCFEGGNLWYLKVRRMQGGVAQSSPKYLQPRGGVRALYGASTLAGRSVAVMVEGEFDAALLWPYAEALGAGVATMGSENTGPGATWGPYLLGLSRVLIAYDADEAGQKGAHELAALLGPRATILHTQPLRVHDKDITDYWRAGGDVGAWLAGWLREVGK